MSSVYRYIRKANIRLFVVLAIFGTGLELRAQEAVTIQLSVKNHRFQPASLHAPANKPIMLKVKNLDSTPMEFESVTLRVEKVITGDSEGIIRLRPLEAGSYNFFDDFHQETQGTLVVK
jgi:Cupredoxin-like domain